MTEEQASSVAREWVAAWNAHDLNAIMEHYDESVQLTSPVAARLLESDGHVVGKANLKAYFRRGLDAYPNLRFELKEVLWGMQSIVLYYTNQNGISVAEFMEFSANGKVTRVVANYGDSITRSDA